MRIDIRLILFPITLITIINHTDEEQGGHKLFKQSSTFSIFPGSQRTSPSRKPYD